MFTIPRRGRFPYTVILFIERIFQRAKLLQIFNFFWFCKVVRSNAVCWRLR